MALGRIEVCFAHYLVENKILRHPRHILSNANSLVLHILLPAKQKQNADISFHHPSQNKNISLQLFTTYISYFQPSSDSHCMLKSMFYIVIVHCFKVKKQWIYNKTKHVKIQHAARIS
jgi:hypothetical protein